ncbi:hypothetical protein MJO29_001210 [Puccinia striiformis f. sp. tritici]|nr:hypothetical protein MJO29_001210 [Puccinia striiformis f. sp. tritici]
MVNGRQVRSFQLLVMLDTKKVSAFLLGRCCAFKFGDISDTSFLLSGPAGIDGSKALNELHSPEGITEEHKSENHQLKGLSLEELNQWLTDVIFPTLGNVGHQKGIISSAKREEIAAHISPNFNNYRDTIGEVELAIEALRFIEDLTRIKVNHVGELPVLKTPEDFRYFVGNQALEVLDKIKEVRHQPAIGPLGDEDRSIRDMLEKIEKVIHSHL